MSRTIRRPVALLPGRRRHRKPDRRPILIGAAAAAALIAAGGALFSKRRRARRHTADQPAPVVPGAPSEKPVTEAVERTWSCECGQEYRVQGEDRHRVYWLPDAAISDPVLTPECVSCGRPLPSEHPAPVADAPEE